MGTTKSAVILAAGVGKRLGRRDLPKCLVEIGGISLLERHLGHLYTAGVENVIVVVGHGADQVEKHVGRGFDDLTIVYLPNQQYRRGSVISLLLGLSAIPMDESAIWMDADVLYPRKMLHDLAKSDADLTCLIDESSADTGEEMFLGLTGDRVMRVDRGGAPGFDRQGESIGFYRVDGSVKRRFMRHLAAFLQAGGEDAEYEAALNTFFPAVEARAISVAGQPWTEIDFPEDLLKAEELLAKL
jgi:choline kinase